MLSSMVCEQLSSNEEPFFFFIPWSLSCHSGGVNDARFLVSGLGRYDIHGRLYRLGIGGIGRIGLGFFGVYMDDMSDTVNGHLDTKCKYMTTPKAMHSFFAPNLVFSDRWFCQCRHCAGCGCVGYFFPMSSATVLIRSDRSETPMTI